MKRSLFIVITVCLLHFSIFPKVTLYNIPSGEKKSKASNEKAAVLVRTALEAMGGESKVRALKSIKIEGIGHVYAVEQSERPEGPFIVTYQQIKELRDLSKQRLVQTRETKQFQVPSWRSVNLIVADGFVFFEAGGRTSPGNVVQIEDAKKQFALAPERILLTALESSDLRLDKNVLMQGVQQRVLKFTWGKTPVAIYLNANTNLPTAVDTLSAAPYEHYWTVWGDFTTRTYYSLWTMGQNGIHYPQQWDVEKNNYAFESFTVTDLKFNEPAADDLFKISDDIKKAFTSRPLTKIDDLPLGLPNSQVAEIASGIVKIPGRWDMAYVRQPDGIVIIESPISSAYSVKVLEEAKKRFPNEKIKAVVTTADAFPHFGGIREYAAQSIPIYALDVNRPIIERMLGMPHKFYPDNLESGPRKANFKIVSGKTIIGDAANRMEIYPFRTETGERMMMIYFPEQKLLYASDMIQPGRRGGFAFPQYLSEVMDAVKRENLTVENVFGMHLGKTLWSDVTKFVESQTAEVQK